MEPGKGSSSEQEQMAGTGREWLESLLDNLPTPTVLIEPSSGRVTFANQAADRMAGGRFPRGGPAERGAASEFRALSSDGTPLDPEKLPGMRAARGERVRNFEFVWETPAGTRSLLANSVRMPASYGQPETVIGCFEDISELKGAQHAEQRTLALLDALFEEAPVGLAYFDRQLRYQRLNPWLAEMNGVPADEHIGRTVKEVLPEMDERIADVFRYVLDTGEAVVDLEFVGATPASDEDERRFSTAVYPVRDPDGEVTGVGVVALEVTARRRAEAERAHALELEREARTAAEDAAARARFLSESSVILDESLDYESTLTSVSRLAVPWLADWCAVDMPEPDGTLRRVTTAHVDPAKIDLAQEWERRYPTDPASATGVPNVIRTGHSEMYPEITDEMLVQGAVDEEHLELIRSLGMRSAMIVPMIARGRTLGAITFIAAETGRRYGDDDLLLAEELARRAATSIDNARLYEERSYIARTLQQSLLPPHLPKIPGLELAGRYRPVGEGNQVGGDFYDLFSIGDDSWAVVIGDVCGKGAEAAALTALVRYTVRAIASPDKLPSEVLQLLNDAILRQRSDNRFSTVVYATAAKSGDGVRLELAVGGHPLPLAMRADGTTELVGQPGTLLGVVPDPALHDVAVDLGPGDSLVFYTDGVTEAGAPDHIMDPDDLSAAVAGCDEGGALQIAECLEAAAVEASDGDPHDDIAIVALHVEARGALEAGEPVVHVTAAG